MLRLRIATALLLAGTCVLACRNQEREPAATGEPTPRAEPEPAPKSAPEPEPAAVVDDCRMLVDGVNDIRAAAIHTRPGVLEATVANGNEISVKCPAPADRKGTDVIAQRESLEVVHWRDVELDPKITAKLDNADALPSVPDDMSPEDLAQIADHFPGSNLAPEPVESEVAAAPPTKVAVTFNAHQQRSAELRYRRRGGAWKQIYLGPSKSRSLAPGTYDVQFRRPPTRDWQDAGSLEVSSDFRKYKINLLSGSPWLDVSRRGKK